MNKINNVVISKIDMRIHVENTYHLLLQSELKYAIVIQNIYTDIDPTSRRFHVTGLTVADHYPLVGCKKVYHLFPPRFIHFWREAKFSVDAIFPVMYILKLSECLNWKVITILLLSVSLVWWQSHGIIQWAIKF